MRPNALLPQDFESREATEMKIPEPFMRDLAIRLLIEASDPGDGAPAAVVVLERLDAVLQRVAGQAGSRSLLDRALSLARTEVPTLEGLLIPSAGPLSDMDWKCVHDGPFDPQCDQVILVAHLLELLRTFIGERLTLQLVKEAWPDLDPSSGVEPLNPTP